VAIALALCASLAFALPVSTPPNAIVHSRGGLGPRDGILPGVLCGLLGWLLVFGSMALYGRIIGR
jgi:sodium-dependent dicarboxylate transporter 2/3/5